MFVSVRVMGEFIVRALFLAHKLLFMETITGNGMSAEDQF